MKKIIYFLILLVAGITANAQFTPFNNLNYMKLLQVPPSGSVEDSVLVYDGSDKFVKMRPSSVLIGEATSTKTGTVKTDVTETNPVVYTKTTTDSKLDLKKNATSTAVTSLVTLVNNGTTFTLSAFTGVIVNNSTVPATRITVNFAGASNVTPLFQLSLLYVDNTGTLQQANGATADLTQLQKVDNIYIGRVVFNSGFILALNLNPTIEYGIDNRFRNLGDKIRNINEGNEIGANGANLQVNKGAGTTWRVGSNFSIDRKVPDETVDIAAIPIPAGVNAIGYRNGTGGWTYEPYTGSITPTFWDNGTGTKATVANNKYTNHRIYFFNATNTYIIYLGRTEHSTLQSAVLEAEKPNSIVDPATTVASLIGTISVEKSCTALNNTALAAFTQGPRMQGGASSGGTSGTQNLQSTYLNSLTPQITTNSTLGAVDFKRGSAADTDKVVRVLNGAGTETFGVTGAGTLNVGDVSIKALSKKTRTDINYVFEGDSRTATGAIPDYPAKLATLSNFAGTGNFYNVATGGNYIADIVSQYATEVYPLKPNGTTITEAYLFVLIGINDLSLTTPDFASLANTVKSYCATAKTDGFKVVLFTTFYRQGFTRTQELARQKYNDYLREGLVTGDYSLIDLENVFPPNQSSIFYLDAVHLLESGNNLIASYVNDKFPLGNTGNSLSSRNLMQDVFTPYSKFRVDGDAEISSLAFSSPNIVYADVAGKLLVEHPFNVIGDTYIKNQNSFYQPASLKIDGTGVFGNDVKIGSGFSGLDFAMEIYTTKSVFGWSTAFLSQNYTVDATYGGIMLGHRENLGVIGEYTSKSISIVPDGGNLLVGTTTNNGVDKLQVNGSISATSYTGSATLTDTPTAPTATAGTNTTQIATTAFVGTANSGNVTLTGNQTITGQKIFTKSGTFSGIIVNSSATTEAALLINNNSTGIATKTENNSTGIANYVNNNSTGVAYYGYNALGGDAFNATNVSTGSAFAANGLTGSTGLVYVGRNNGTDTFKVTKEGTMMLGVYTVATLPTPTGTAYATVSDATAPTYLGTLTGGGSVVCPVFYNGSAWVSH